ncbi:MAG: site-2 protease family protein [Planctomycetaceae bacterium]
MLGQFAPTPFDLRFHLLGIPVMVHPTFWLLGALIGWMDGHLDFTLLNVMLIFLSILVHEMGHALLQRRWGDMLYIQLHMTGGAASFIPGPGFTPKRSILVSLAGPFAGFLLAGIAHLTLVILLQTIDQTLPFFKEHPKLTNYLFHSLVVLRRVNILWGILNLLPIIPLDGGHVSMEVSQLISRVRGDIWAYRISIVTAIVVILLSAYFHYQSQFLVIICLFLGYQNWQMLNHRTGRNW